MNCGPRQPPSAAPDTPQLSERPLAGGRGQLATAIPRGAAARLAEGVGVEEVVRFWCQDPAHQATSSAAVVGHGPGTQGSPRRSGRGTRAAAGASP